MFNRPKRISPARQVLVTDQAVQGALLVRLALYGAGGLLYFSVIELLDVALSDTAHSRGEILWNFMGQTIYWAPGLFVLMPIFAYDLLRVSNGFTGPVLRLRREMKALTLGEDREPIEFRADDFWQEMAAEYNLLRKEVNKLREQLAAVPQAENATTVRKGSLFGGKGKAKAEDSKTMDEMLESVGA